MRSPLRALKIALPETRRGAFLVVVIGIHLVASWCNGGFLNADEHYQIIEFAQFKLGRQAEASLAWEFAEHMRPALQPWLAAGAISGFHAGGIASPFVIALWLRLLSTGLAVWMTFELCARCLEPIRQQWVREAALWMSFALWITPMAHARFSSENWGAALAVAGLCLVLEAVEARPDRRTRAVSLAACAGIAWSAAFYCRFQIGLAIGGGVLWMLFVRRSPLDLVLAIVVAFAIGCGLNEILDRWLYGFWTCVPCNYFRVNVIADKASTFGVAPWWMVGAYMAVILIPPYSLVVLALFAIGSWYARRHVLVWMILPFVIAHAIVPHKEARFLTPLVYFLGPWLAVCVDALPQTARAVLSGWVRSPFGRANLAVWCAVNAVLLSVAIVMPANDTDRIDRWLWDRSRNGPLTLYTAEESPYQLSQTVTNSFYSSPNVRIAPLPADGSLLASGSRGPMFVYYRGIEPPAIVTSAGPCPPLLRTFPTWLAQSTYFVKLTDVRLATLCQIKGAAVGTAR